MKLIKEDVLKQELEKILKIKTRNQVVNEIKEKQKTTFHQYNIDKFLLGHDVSLSTLKKIETYLNNSPL